MEVPDSMSADKNKHKKLKKRKPEPDLGHDTSSTERAWKEASKVGAPHTSYLHSQRTNA